MKIAYAFRRSTFYPYRDDSLALPGGAARTRFLTKVRETGFDGIELGADVLGGLEATERDVGEIRRELEGHGTPCVVVKAGGGMCAPAVAVHNRALLMKSIEIADWLGAGTVNTSLVTPPENPDLPGTFRGEPVSQGSSRLASPDDFERTAEVLREAGEMAGARGINISVEVHQNTIADNSRAALRLLDLTDSANVFANPDLGNIYWTYDEPEETSDDAILALAPRSAYWHCKNLRRVHIPENEHAIFIRVPLPDGEIDYRFAISAMHEAGFDGYLAVEGATHGDQLHADRRSFEYVKGVLAEVEGAGGEGPVDG